jgi:hypothetical protein
MSYPSFPFGLYITLRNSAVKILPQWTQRYAQCFAEFLGLFNNDLPQYLLILKFYLQKVNPRI